ncbi:transcriptional regulator [Lysinibacillus fusiformis]|uniref:helix-turn-helix transcriptional regulator n=1 Tax=Lysinibacillus fusiformis TaxID=28031 RepID=UPI000BBB57BA|nr:YafY family protein [Lysinibacillus fusiformis]PCD82767.1 transcriptional regulator [Lysinibacillus fusiformis]
MSKAKRLIDILLFVSAKKQFTAQEIADAFNISVRTVHRYLLDLSDMGLPIYAEQGRNGGYTVLSSTILPPILFTEEEAVAIFFAFQSLHYYRDLPFNTEMKSVSQKLYESLQKEAQKKVDSLQSYIAFWNPKRAISTPLLSDVLEAIINHSQLDIQYESKSGITTKHVHPIGVYAHDGLWYMPAIHLQTEKTLLFRVDRIHSMHVSDKGYETTVHLQQWLESPHEPQQPIRLHVELTREGVRQCRSEPNFEKVLVTNSNGTGYIDMMIDQGEIHFISSFFYRLGPDAIVQEPPELIQLLRKHAQTILATYLLDG